jgi:hypothetical protein
MYTDSNRGMSVSTNGHLGKRWLFHGSSHGWWKYYCLLLLIPNVKYIFHSSVFPQAHTNNNSTDTNFHLHKFIKMGHTWGSTSCMLRQMSCATFIIPLVWHDPPPHHPHTQKKSPVESNLGICKKSLFRSTSDYLSCSLILQKFKLKSSSLSNPCTYCWHQWVTHEYSLDSLETGTHPKIFSFGLHKLLEPCIN